MKNRIKEISDTINKNLTSKTKLITTQNLVKKMRGLQEQEEESIEDRKTVYDQEREETNFMNNINDLGVDVEFYPLKVHDDLIYWGGIVDGVIEFIYRVTPYEETSGKKYKYHNDIDPENPDNAEIIDRIDNYYDQFYKYWRNNVLQT